MNYETLNEQEWLVLLTEMAKADNVIKRKLAISSLLFCTNLMVDNFYILWYD